eukprot:Em0001g3044a
MLFHSPVTLMVLLHAVLVYLVLKVQLSKMKKVSYLKVMKSKQHIATKRQENRTVPVCQQNHQCHQEG